MSILDWMTKQQALARGLQDRRQSEVEFPNRLREQDTMDAMRQLLMQQSQESFPLQMRSAEHELARKQAAVPAEDFARDTAAFGPFGGAEQLLQQRPELAMQLWGNNPEAMSGGATGPPDLRSSARAAASNLYTGGVESAAKARQTAEMFPFQKELANIVGQWGVRQHQGAMGNQMELLRRKQESEAAGAASALINQSPATQAFNALLQAIPQIKTIEEAETMMKQMSAIGAQLGQLGKNALSTGVGMGGNPEALRQLVDQQIYEMQRTLRAQYDMLVSKFYTQAPARQPSTTFRGTIPYPDPEGGSVLPFP